MTSDQIKPLIASTVRHGLTLLAGYLVARGALSPTTAGRFVEGLSGVLVGLIGYGWSLARAGKLGEQAKTITALIEGLTNSVPAAMVGGNTAADGSSTRTESSTSVITSTPVVPVPVTAPPNGGPLPNPMSPWPMGSPQNPGT